MLLLAAAMPIASQHCASAHFYPCLSLFALVPDYLAPYSDTDMRCIHVHFSSCRFGSSILKNDSTRLRMHTGLLVLSHCVLCGSRATCALFPQRGQTYNLTTHLTLCIQDCLRSPTVFPVNPGPRVPFYLNAGRPTTSQPTSLFAYRTACAFPLCFLRIQGHMCPPSSTQTYSLLGYVPHTCLRMCVV